MINNLNFFKLAFLVLFAVNLYKHVITLPIQCGLESNCTITEDSEVCIFDESEDCIRKYPSKCHLDIAACKLGKNFNDYSELYCEMEVFLCEKGYEHWSIFFGNENS